MRVNEIEALPEIQQAAQVLSHLEGSGIVEPAIASGYTRTLLTSGETPDIDVSYVGPVHFEQAQEMLVAALDAVDPDNRDMWDIEGIWNAQMHDPRITSTKDNFLVYYVNSIDSVYLASDGKLHDPTGFGFSDAANRILRMNMYDLELGPTSDHQEVNTCLEVCRRIALHGWTPTDPSIERVRAGVERWKDLGQGDLQYFTGKLVKKYANNDELAAQEIYEQYGWGFIFDEEAVVAGLQAARMG